MDRESLLENDDAQDFLQELSGGKNRWSRVANALNLPTGDRDDEASCLAAAEIVAAARGHADEGLDPDLLRWASKVPKNVDDLTRSAIEATARVRANSELRDLNDESGRADVWEAAIDSLLLRLQSPIATPPKTKRVRPMPGDVFEISLPTGQHAYLRLTHDPSVYCIYDFLSDEPSHPPIGLRRYRFVQIGMWDEIRSGLILKVGQDPFSEDEPERIPDLFWEIYPGRFDYAAAELGAGLFLRYMIGTESRKRPARLEECIGLPYAQEGGYRIDSVVQRLLEGEQGPIARKCQPLLSDGSGRLLRRRWSDWSPKWIDKMPRTYESFRPLADAVFQEEKEYEKAFWAARPELFQTIRQFNARYSEILKRNNGCVPSHGSEDAEYLITGRKQ